MPFDEESWPVFPRPYTLRFLTIPLYFETIRDATRKSLPRDCRLSIPLTSAAGVERAISHLYEQVDDFRAAFHSPRQPSAAAFFSIEGHLRI